MMQAQGDGVMEGVGRRAWDARRFERKQQSVTIVRKFSAQMACDGSPFFRTPRRRSACCTGVETGGAGRN